MDRKLNTASRKMKSITSRVSNVVIFILFLCVPNKSRAYSFRKIPLPGPGSESYAFDSNNNGPYTGLNDGRIVKYTDPTTGFLDFAIIAPNRSKKLCDGKNVNDLKSASLCGRPVGLEFNHRTGELYITDAFRGLMVVGSHGGVAAQLTGGKDGVPFDLLDGIAINPITGTVYFTDLGTIFYKSGNATEILLSGDKTGRLLKYDPKTRQRKVVLTGLSVPNGVVVSADGSFVLIAEYVACRIRRYWLTGSRAHTSETFVELPGNPDNIRRTETGDFWVPINIQKLYPKPDNFPVGLKISAQGQILKTVNFYKEYNATIVTEVQEHGGSLYVASVYTDFVGIYRGLEC